MRRNEENDSDKPSHISPPATTSGTRLSRGPSRCVERAMRTAGCSDNWCVNRYLKPSESAGAMRFRLSDDDLPIVLLLVAMAAFAWVTPAQNDTWWHLRSGREILETRSFLTTEHFSHSS